VNAPQKLHANSTRIYDGKFEMTEPAYVMPHMGLYYPYIHFRSGPWLKLAALYWPRMARVVSPGYPTRNSRLVDVLNDELGFVIDIDPGQATAAAAKAFAKLIDLAEPDALRRLMLLGQEAHEIDYHRLALPRPPADLGGSDSNTPDSCIPVLENYTPGWTMRDTAGVHDSEIAAELRSLLIETQLAVPARGEWLAMHPALAWAYKVRLTEEIARRNNLVPATDQLPAHAIVEGPVTIEALADLTSPLPPASGAADIQTTFGLLSIEAVVPRDLDCISPEKITEIRKRFAAEFDLWRDYSDAVGRELSEQLRGIESPSILRAYLDDAVRRFATGPVKDLRKGLTDIGIDTATTAISSKFELPASLAIAATQPHLAAAGASAIGLLNLRQNAKRRARAKQRTPAAYLMNIEDSLSARTSISRIMSLMRRAAGIIS
jgi:hypothetical protein